MWWGANPSPGNPISLPAGDAEGEIRGAGRWPLVSDMVRVRAVYDERIRPLVHASW